MGLFGRKAADKTQDALVRTLVDGRCWNDPALDAGVDAVEEGHLTAGLTLLKESRTDPELRSLYVEALGNAAIGRSGQVHGLLTEDTAREDAADILLWLGRTLIDEAWEIRGAGSADTVGAERFKLFFATLGNAREPLLAAAEIAADDPVPWECLQWFALGMQLERDEKDYIWQRVVERCPTLYPAHWGRVQTLAAKWGGSHEEMLEFARGSVDIAPPGHPLTSMVALAHVERLMGLFDDLAQRRKFVAAVKLNVRYYDEQVRDELTRAAQKWCAAPVAHPRDLQAHHQFGWVFKEAQEKERARWHLYQVGDRVHHWPWASTGKPVEAFAKALSSLGLA
ncbi:hypothetical protein [Nocardiopsis ansamitocini]|uniref:DUF4034 domain-containing protein n=1 Tax=Nocardiopsis ansamitocini TaxID=1670832 RepID=A0A9W6UGT4_9ACTN|nr:hypothetical protein [Nocardiopsis ansamitocini]GLU48046.1 hypothetical protein Nans01_23970 [Nocardiopsis ansamitocini]